MYLLLLFFISLIGFSKRVIEVEILCSCFRWFIPMNVVLGSISGSLIGLAVAYIIHPPYPYFKFTIVQVGIGESISFGTCLGVCIGCILCHTVLWFFY